MTLPAFLAVESEPFSDADLDAYIEDQAVPEDQIPDGTFWRIDSTGEAEWAMAKYAEHRQAIINAGAQAVEWEEIIDTWLTRERKPHEASLAFFEALLDWMRTRREADPKCKTINLPSGALRSTHHAERPKVADPEALAEWALEHAPDVVETTHRVPARALKGLVDVVEEFDLVSVILSCDHMVVSALGVDYEPGEMLPCPDCSVEEVVSRPVVSAEAHTRRVVHLGEPVPGVEVEASHITFNVVAS